MHELLDLGKVLRVCAHGHAIGSELHCGVGGLPFYNGDDLGTATYRNWHNALDLFKPEYSPPWLLQVHSEGVPDVRPQLSVIRSVWIEPEWLC